MLAVHRPVVSGVIISEMLCLVGRPAWRVSRLGSVEVTTSRILVLVSDTSSARDAFGVVYRWSLSRESVISLKLSSRLLTEVTNTAIRPQQSLRNDTITFYT